MRRAAALAVRAATWGLVAWVATGCVTIAEFRKLEHDVNKLKGEGVPASSGGRAQVADLAVDLDTLRVELEMLQGRIEVAEHRAEEALTEARAARQEAALPAAAPAGTPGMPAEPGADPLSTAPAEVEAYRAARASWREGDLEACIERFREFLKSYESSEHADDAAYWMADCHLRQGNLEMAILRFDDVVRRYPTTDKAPEALYRQGEALLRLGPSHGQAAQQAFQRLVDEYPDSERVAEARRQLELLSPG